MLQRLFIPDPLSDAKISAGFQSGIRGSKHGTVWRAANATVKQQADPLAMLLLVSAIARLSEQP